MEHEFIRFKLAGKSFALPIEVVKSTAKVEKIYPLPGLKQSAGLVSVNGAIVLLIDLGFLLKLRKNETSDGKVIVFKYDDDLLGFLVENWQEVINIDEKAIKDASQLGDNLKVFSSGVFEIEGELTIILDLAKIFADLF